MFKIEQRYSKTLSICTFTTILKLTINDFISHHIFPALDIYVNYIKCPVLGIYIFVEIFSFKMNEFPYGDKLVAVVLMYVLLGN